MSLREYFSDGLTFEEFLEASGNRGRSFRRNYENAVIPEDMVEVFAREVEKLGGLRILVMSEAWCPDAAANIPPLVKFFEEVEGEVEVPVEVVHRFRDESPDLKNMLEGRGVDKIPAVVLADGDYREIGYWQERPAPAQALVDRIKELRERGLESAAEARELREGYASGQLVRSALEEILDIIAT
ncbi:MAG: thioredoxin family protein [Bacillota bacterium]